MLRMSRLTHVRNPRECSRQSDDGRRMSKIIPGLRHHPVALMDRTSAPLATIEARPA